VSSLPRVAHPCSDYYFASERRVRPLPPHSRLLAAAPLPIFFSERPLPRFAEFYNLVGISVYRPLNPLLSPKLGAMEFVPPLCFFSFPITPILTLFIALFVNTNFPPHRRSILLERYFSCASLPPVGGVSLPSVFGFFLVNLLAMTISSWFSVRCHSGPSLFFEKIAMAPASIFVVPSPRSPFQSLASLYFGMTFIGVKSYSPSLFSQLSSSCHKRPPPQSLFTRRFLSMPTLLSH